MSCLWNIPALAQAQNLLYELNKDLEAIRELPLNTEHAYDVSPFQLPPQLLLLDISIEAAAEYESVIRRISHGNYGVRETINTQFQLLDTLGLIFQK